ncbi:MAG: FG-GAP-like repeat-containing protein, partial [Chromatiales bacterium]
VGFSVPTTPASYSVNYEISGVGDFDGDGKADIVFRHKTAGTNRIWFMDGATRVGSSVGIDTLASLSWIIAGAGDFDGDGDADILFRNKVSGANRIWFMDGAARVGNLPTTPASIGPSWVVGN